MPPFRELKHTGTHSITAGLSESEAGRSTSAVGGGEGLHGYTLSYEHDCHYPLTEPTRAMSNVPSHNRTIIGLMAA